MNRDLTTEINTNKKHRNDIVVVFFILYFFIIIGLVLQWAALSDVVIGGEGSFITIDFRTITENIPVNILIEGLFLVTVIYIGAQGSISLFKTLTAPKGDFATVPKHKMKRFVLFMASWFILGIITYIFISSSSGQPSQFFTDSIFKGIVASAATYVYSRNAKAVAPLSISKESEMNIRDDNNKTISEEDF